MFIDADERYIRTLKSNVLEKKMKTSSILHQELTIVTELGPST